jgi:Flp pilus assembly protein TadD/predicted Ser/Thr protein kinase
MTEGRRARLWDLFDRAADLPPGEQQALLDAACPDDPALRAEVERLLADDARLRTERGGAPFLDSPVVRPATPAALAPTLAAGPALPARIGHYRVVRLLGEGGMGAVYEAEQDSPRRTVALKVIRPGLVSPALLKRFAQEAQILGRLHHPGVAAIYEAGVAEDGQPFFALEFIRGEPLDEYASRHGLDAAARLALLAWVCDAVQHAHDQGVIHRDLKPANILVDETGQPKVLDFGVARATGTDLLTSTHHTRTGQLLGTLSYMSPEQVAANPAGVDRRSDVYALGVILYELLAHRPPYNLDGLPLPEAARVIREQEPARLGALEPRLRGDVETIVARALAKEPPRRYASPAELAADLRRHLRYEPIRARPPSALYQLGKFVRRHKAVVMTTAAFLALLLGVGAVTAWQAVTLARAERDEAVRQAVRSREVHEALARATALRDEARATNNLDRWAEAREEARRAEARAEGGPIDPGLAERVAALRRELDEEEKDRRMIARLEAAPLLQAEVNVKKNLFAEERALPEYRQAFADYGLRPDVTVPAEAAALLGRRPAAVRAAVVAGLDHWLDLARHEKAAEAGWLEEVLSAADPDDWRQRLRVARGRRDPQALLALAREVKVATQRPQALLLLYRGLRASGAHEDALGLLRDAQEAYPGDFWINENLGRSLTESQPPQLDEAIRFLTAAVALRPDSPGARFNLGVALANKGRLDEAIAAYRKATDLKPDYAQAYRNLGVALARRGRSDEAITAYRKVAELMPTSALAHQILGIALHEHGDLAGAVASYRSALAIDPKSAGMHNNLGSALQSLSDLPKAIASFRRALDLEPKVARFHYNLGNALWLHGDLSDAAASYRRALALDPNYAEAHCNLGHVLLRQGEFGKALAEFETGHDLGSRRADWTHPSPQWVEVCKRFIELNGRLPAILKGVDGPPSAAECIELADLCSYKRLYVTSVRFFTDAFTADPKLAEDFRAGHRYRAAAAAAQAGCGRGEEAARLDARGRTRLRQQALKWLRADLAWVTAQRKGGTPAAALRGWQIDHALAGVRNTDRLAALPAAERAGWEKLWADVAAVVPGPAR